MFKTIERTSTLSQTKNIKIDDEILMRLSNAFSGTICFDLF